MMYTSNEVLVTYESGERVRVEKDILFRTPKSYKVSIVLPSRKRLEKMITAINSVYETADQSNLNFEIIVKFDLDDADSISYITEIGGLFPNLSFIISPRFNGWINMVDYVEDMISLAKGEYIFGINDDMIFKTPSWNTIIEENINDFKIYFPMVNGYREAFPIFPKKLKDILGHISLHSQIDTYLKELGDATDLCKYIDFIEVEHTMDFYESPDEVQLDRTDKIPKTFAARDYHRNSPEFKKDVKKIQEYLKNE